jgi:hypothetical protein
VTDQEFSIKHQSQRPRTLEDDRPRTPRRRKKKRGSGVTALIGSLAGGLGLVLVWTFIIITNPASPFNPFGAGSAPTATLWAPPTSTATPATLPATWTASPVPSQGTATATFPAPATLTPTPQEEIAIEFSTPDDSGPDGGTPTFSIFPFTIDEAPKYAKNTGPDGCAWMSIAGNVLDLEGNPLTSVGVQVRGENFESFQWAGAEPRFGVSGYEVILNLSPYVANWTIQLISDNVRPLSREISVQSSSDCNRNVVIVNFIQNHEFNP